MSQALRKITGALNTTGTTAIFINHLFPQWARKIGMPRGYGYGASMGAWVTDYLAGWAGEHGMVAHSIANYRGPALS